MFTVETLERTHVDTVNIWLAIIHPEEGTSMFSNTYLTAALAALTLVAFTQTSGASDTATHWSSRIGTGQPFVPDSGRDQSRTTSNPSASAHWSARIGTGRDVAESEAAPAPSTIAGVPGPTHWSARIGTGQASPGADVWKVADRKKPAEARVITEPLGEHPAARVARSWSSRGIDSNTFIVRHPAGPIWVHANTTSDTAARAVRTASASSK
jgi:hypothetical protein